MAQGERAELTAITAPIDGNHDSGGRLLFAAAFVKPVGTNTALYLRNMVIPSFSMKLLEGATFDIICFHKH